MTIALELQQLKKTYPGGVQALRGIDLQVEAGDFYALLGPNGAGKSTTIGIISSLVNKTSGRVSVFGYDLEKDVVNAKRQLGLVSQEFNFNPFETVQQIVVNQAGYYGAGCRRLPPGNRNPPGKRRCAFPPYGIQYQSRTDHPA